MASILPRIRNSAFARLADRAAGTPLLWLLGALRPKRPAPAAIRCAGIMVFETIGDTLLASALVGSLRANDPRVQIIVFASRANLGVLPLIEGIHAVVEVPLMRPLRALAAVRSAPVDVMIDIGQWPRWYAALCALSRSRYTIGFATPGQSRHYAYDAAVPHARDVHEVENFGRLLRPLGVPPLPPERALKPVPAQAPARLGLRLPYVVIHPWASGFRFASREWPLPRWAELIARVGQLGFCVLVTGSPSDRDRAADLIAAAAGSPARSIAGDVSLQELAAVLRGAAAAVSVNTGVMHLASLLDVPLVALNGPTNRRRWGPLGRRSIALAPSPGPDSEFLHLGFEYPASPVHCMDRIGVDEVLAAVQALLAGTAPSPEAA